MKLFTALALLGACNARHVSPTPRRIMTTTDNSYSYSTSYSYSMSYSYSQDDATP